MMPSPFLRTLQLLLVVAGLSVGWVAAEDAEKTKFTAQEAKRIQTIWDDRHADPIEAADIGFQFKVVGPKWVKPLTKDEVFTQIQKFDIDDNLALEHFISSVSTKDLPGTPGGSEIHLIVKGDRIYEQGSHTVQAVNRDEVVRVFRTPKNKQAFIDIYQRGESPHFINQLSDFRIDPPRKFQQPFADNQIEVIHRRGDEYELKTSSEENRIQLAYSFSQQTGNVYERMIATPTSTQWRVARYFEKVRNGPETIDFPRLTLDFDFDKHGKLLRMYARVLKSIKLDVDIPDEQFELSVTQGDVVIDSRQSRSDPRVFRSRRVITSAADATPLRAPMPSSIVTP